MAGSERSSHVDPPGGSRGRLFRLRPLRVLVVSADERFRAVASMLIARRGCEVFTAPEAGSLAELVVRERIDVVVVEGEDEWTEVSLASASLDGVSPPVGLVAVAEEAGRSPSGHMQVAKWGPFRQLFAAIELAELCRADPRAAAGSGWPPAQERESGGV